MIRRFALVASAAALVLAPLAVSTAASADTQAVSSGAAATTAASCLHNAVTSGSSPTAAAANCLDSQWSVAAFPSANLAGASCVQAVQDPWTPNGLTLEWGTIIICNVPVTGTTFTGVAETSGGVVVDASAGPGLPVGSAVQLWNNVGACPLPGYYRSVITSAVAVNPGVSNALLLQTGNNAFVNCIP